MSVPVHSQRVAVTCSRSILRKYIVAATSIILGTSIGTCSAFAEESKKETEKTADSQAAVSDGSEWDAYANEVEKQVLRKWFPPRGIKVYKAVRVAMRIRNDGRLSGVHITRSSQIGVVDEAARKAVRNAAPFKPFPDGLKKENFANFEIRFDRWDVTSKRKIIRKLDRNARPERDDYKERF